MALISIIVPVYKVEPYLRRCVDSILAQTFTDFELILVDDGSPDNCGVICDEYASLHNNVKVIHQNNQGLSAARNAGIDFIFENSDSNWLTFIDSDDWVHPQYLELLLKAAIENDVTISVCGFIKTFGEEPEIKNDGIEINVLSPEKLYVENNVNATVPWGKLYTKECFKEIRYPVGKIHEDEFVTYKIIFNEHKIAVVEANLYFYFYNDSGITKSNWSPKRLQVLEAVKHQIVYMREHKFKNAYKHALVKYVLCHTNIIYRIKDEKSIKYYKYIPRLRIKAKYMLIRYHKLLPIEKYPGAYDKAFPLFMYFYWIIKAQIRKIIIRFNANINIKGEK